MITGHDSGTVLPNDDVSTVRDTIPVMFPSRRGASKLYENGGVKKESDPYGEVASLSMFPSRRDTPKLYGNHDINNDSNHYRHAVSFGTFPTHTTPPWKGVGTDVSAQNDIHINTHTRTTLPWKGDGTDVAAEDHEHVMHPSHVLLPRNGSEMLDVSGLKLGKNPMEKPNHTLLERLPSRLDMSASFPTKLHEHNLELNKGRYKLHSRLPRNGDATTKSRNQIDHIQQMHDQNLLNSLMQKPNHTLIDRSSSQLDMSASFPTKLQEHNLSASFPTKLQEHNLSASFPTKLQEHNLELNNGRYKLRSRLPRNGDATTESKNQIDHIQQMHEQYKMVGKVQRKMYATPVSKVQQIHN
jgi:hypothetical protein